MSCNHEYICEDENEKEMNQNGNSTENEILNKSPQSEYDQFNSPSETDDISYDKKELDSNILTDDHSYSNELKRPRSNSVSLLRNSQSSTHDNLLHILLPRDSQIYLLSFLNPEDLTILSCVSQYSNKLASDPLLWKTLLLRDYHYILTQWPLAETAFHRFPSTTTPSSSTILDFITHCATNSNDNHNKPTMKHLYFTFTKYWIDWSIAGLNGFECSYIGLHNSVFDITNFIRDHPGSPETILMHAGRDATQIFEDLGHSKRARDLAAKNLCVINLGYDYYNHKKDWEVHQDDDNIDDACSNVDRSIVSLPMMRSRSKRKSPRILYHVKKQLEKEEKIERLKIKNWRKATKDVEILGNVNFYYDPFFQKWRWWYSDINMDPIFMDSIG